MDTDLDPEFRFSSKKEYEDEMKRLILAQNSKKRRDSSLDEQYEDLMDEYLKFCATMEDA